MENILVIGNGFDIAHGFNTRYEDFINFCKTLQRFIKDLRIINSYIKMNIMIY